MAIDKITDFNFIGQLKKSFAQIQNRHLATFAAGQRCYNYIGFFNHRLIFYCLTALSLCQTTTNYNEFEFAKASAKSVNFCRFKTCSFDNFSQTAPQCNET